MPELPDLAVVSEYLKRNMVGLRIVGAEMVRPTVMRDLTGEGLPGALAGRRFTDASRRGKFLLLVLDDGGRYVIISPMLAGRLYHVSPQTRRRQRTYVVLSLCDGSELRYVDTRSMGKVYITDHTASVPGLSSLGPDALDPDLTLGCFQQRVRKYRTDIKSILCRQSFIAGIGNAYADEILFRAGVYPFRRRATLSNIEIERVYTSMHEVLEDAIRVLRDRTGGQIGHEEETRDFLKVHRRGGQPCPICGAPISEISAQRRITSFCRRCQPGSLVSA